MLQCNSYIITNYVKNIQTHPATWGHFSEENIANDAEEFHTSKVYQFESCTRFSAPA
jgi:hypothetical protein